MKQLFSDFRLAWQKYFAFRVYIALVVVAALFQFLQQAMLIDSAEYMNAALNLGELNYWDCCYRGHLCDVLFHQTRRTPGYPFYLLLTGAGGSFSRLIQIIPAVLIPVLSLRLLSHFPRHYKAEFVLMWLFLLYPLQFYYSSLIMPEIWVQFFLLLLAIALTQKKYAASVVYASVLALFKPVFLPFLFLSFMLFPFLSKSKKLILLFPLCLYLFIGFANKKQTGVFHYTSIATVNAWDYNARAVINRNYNLSAAEKLMDYNDSLVRTMPFSAGMKLLDQQTRNIIASNLLSYAFLHIRGSVITLFDPGRYDFVAWWQLPEGKGLMGIKGGHGLKAFFMQPLLYLVYIILFLILAVLKVFYAFRGLIFNIKYQQVWILFSIIVIPIALVGPVGSARYLMPVAPILFIFCVMGLRKPIKTANENSAHQ